MMKKKTKKKALRLMNWPPSRGPMPAWMRAKPTFTIPEPKIEMIELVEVGKPIRIVHKGLSARMTPPPTTFRSRKPATEIKRIPTPPPPKPRGRKLPRGTFRLSDMRAIHDAQREVDLSLFVSVETVATLKPEQWSLISGARLGKSRRSRRAFATTEGYLPVRSYTFDLTYPMSVVARVTIDPYTYRMARGIKRENMSVGYLLWQLARAYKAIYKKHKQYGIWGHAIGDLTFESLKIEDNVGVIGIGS